MQFTLLKFGVILNFPLKILIHTTNTFDRWEVYPSIHIRWWVLRQMLHHPKRLSFNVHYVILSPSIKKNSTFYFIFYFKKNLLFISLSKKIKQIFVHKPKTHIKKKKTKTKRLISINLTWLNIFSSSKINQMSFNFRPNTLDWNSTMKTP